MIIAVDFDGTIVEHKYPLIGPAVPEAKRFLQAAAKAGARLILWTVRSDATLDEAIAYCKANDIPLWGVNENPGQKGWSISPKAYAQIYVDDAALGCPLVQPVSGKPYVDWKQVGPIILRLLGVENDSDPKLFT